MIILWVLGGYVAGGLVVSGIAVIVIRTITALRPVDSQTTLQPEDCSVSFIFWTGVLWPLVTTLAVTFVTVKLVEWVLVCGGFIWETMVGLVLERKDDA